MTDDDFARGIDDDTFIRNVFRLIVRREPTEREFADWRWGLYQGQARAQMVAGLIGSKEVGDKIARLEPQPFSPRSSPTRSTRLAATRKLAYPKQESLLIGDLLQGCSLTIVTATSEKYAPLFFGLHASLGRWRDHLRFIDLGVNDATKKEISRRGIKPQQIPEKLFEGISPAEPHLRAVYAIPFLPQFVDADIIIWIDADCWVQRLEAFERYIFGALAFPDSFTICPILDADYDRCIDSYADYQQMYWNVHEQLLGREAADFLYGKAILSGGVHAAQRTSPVWAQWQSMMGDLYTRNEETATVAPLGHIAEQQTLNLVLHRTGLFNCLTAEMNWHCNCSEVERDGDVIRVVPSGRVPGIVHLCEFTRHEHQYRAKRLLYEDNYGAVT